MEETIHQIRVRIMDEDYILAGDESDEYIQLLAKYVNQKMQAIHSKNPGLSRSRVAVLTALNMADELNQVHKMYDGKIQLTGEE